MTVLIMPMCNSGYAIITTTTTRMTYYEYCIVLCNLTTSIVCPYRICYTMTMANTKAFIHNTELNENNLLSHLLDSMGPDMSDHLGLIIKCTMILHIKN